MIDAASILKFIEQIALAKNQLDIATRQIQALTGGRGLGMIMNDPSIRATLPQDVRDLLGQLDGAMSGLGASTESILSQVREPVTDFKSERAQLYERSEELSARMQALNQAGYEALNKRSAQIDGLQQQIDQTQDPKAIAELQARIQIEQSNIAIEQQRLDAGRKQLESEKELLAHRTRRVYSGWFTAPLRPGDQTGN